MARTAKCRICGKVLNTNEAFKIEGKPAKYFCSEQEYQAEEERKNKAAEDKDKAYELICRIIGRETIINTALWSEWREWSKVADDAKIGQFLAENEEYLTGVIGRLTDAEFPRIRYLSAVLKNRLGDYKVQEEVKVQFKVQPRVVQEEHYETKYKPKARKALLDFEEDYDGE
jgi:hypothetical protein